MVVWLVFQVRHETSAVLNKFRERSRTLWRGDNRPAVRQTENPSVDERAAAALAKTLSDKAARLFSSKDIKTRQEDAQNARAVSEKLVRNLPDVEHGNVAAPHQHLQNLWGVAADTTRRVLSTREMKSIRRDVQNELKTLPPSAVTGLDGDRGPEEAPPDERSSAAGRARRPTADESDPFADIDDAQYEALVDAYEADCASHPSVETYAPLNPEQRAAGRDFIKVAILRRAAIRNRASAGSLAADVKKAGLRFVQLVNGPGGTGKSVMIHAINREFKRRGLRYLVVTAYTGVAVVPFGGPTLLALMNMSIYNKDAARVRSHNDMGAVTQCRNKFREECGTDIDDVDGIIIDESSFLDMRLIGHVDATLKLLLNVDTIVAGGMPLLLSGDNHQKPLPGSTPWYKSLVQAAVNPRDSPAALGATSAKKRGWLLLREAKRHDLTRLMRSRGDPDFMQHLMHMRLTDSTQPVPTALIDGLRKLSAVDIRRDPTWRFTPIGVLSHIERDSLNLAQLHAFAKQFNLPVVRWRVPLKNDVLAGDAMRERLYEAEPNLWQYFVRGAPLVLTETIKATRNVVRGALGLLDSLEVASDADAMAVAAARGYCTVDISQPVVVNAIVGGGPKGTAAARYWHEVELDDLSGVLPNYVEGEQIIPLVVSKNAYKADCHSDVAALEGIDAKQEVFVHQYAVGFALTDYRLQGRTLPRLILSIFYRQRAPYMSLQSLYTLISRVRRADSLRLLQNDTIGRKAATALLPDEYLHSWEHGYDADRIWSDAICAEVFTQRRDAIRVSKQTAATSRKDETIRRATERREETTRRATEKREAQAETREMARRGLTEVAAMRSAESATVGATSEAEQPRGERAFALSICLSCQLCSPIMCNDTNEKQIVTLSQRWHLMAMHAVERAGTNGKVE